MKRVLLEMYLLLKKLNALKKLKKPTGKHKNDLDNSMEIFNKIYIGNQWGSKESVSGPGSTLKATETVRKMIPILIKIKNIKSILDIPCGDFNWMKEVPLNINYLGADIIKELITKNKEKYERENVHFLKLNIIKDLLPKNDLILCRDCLVHFSYKDIFTSLRNIKKSGSRYLLTITFPDITNNKDIKTGEWRALNLELPPFNLKRPILIINEGLKGEYSGKSLALWNIKEINI